MKQGPLLAFLVLLTSAYWLVAQEAKPAAGDSLPPLNGRRAPDIRAELWQGFDPRRDPLDTEVVREWKEGDATYRYVVFTVGLFHSQKSRVAAFYGFPKGGKQLPAVMHLHGGGQRAFLQEVRDAVKFGFVGLSVNWGGREMEEARPGDKGTDYNAIQLQFNSFKNDKSLDPGESARNEGWFLATLVGRRGLTFLEQQPEVDPARIGVYGHSMGGKLTVDVAGSDHRVAAAVNSCGGAGDIVYGDRIWWITNSFWKRKTPGMLWDRTINSLIYLPTLTCPILNLNPMNDFHSPLDIMTENWEHIGSKEVRYACAPHRNHSHIWDTQVCQWLWFEQWLDHDFEMPQTPGLQMDYSASDGVPLAVVRPDPSQKVKQVDIYYSVDPHTITRFWRDAEARDKDGSYRGRCAVMDVEGPLYVLANVTYQLAEPFRTKYGTDHYTITSKELIILAEDLRAAGVKATDHASPLVEDFARGWHDWYGEAQRGVMSTRKIKDPKWRGPDGATLCLDVLSPQDAALVFEFSYNAWEAFKDMGPEGTYTARAQIKGRSSMQTLQLQVADLKLANSRKNAPATLTNWQWVTELTLKGNLSAIKKIYWSKAVRPLETTAASRELPVSTNIMPKREEYPELRGQSEEFKAAVRKSLEGPGK